MEQMPAGMLRIHQLVQFPAKNLYLLVRENANALQIATFPKNSSCSSFRRYCSQSAESPASSVPTGW